MNNLLEYSDIKSKHKEYFKRNVVHVFTSRQEKVKAVKKVGPDISEIIGAYAADGNITVLVRIYSEEEDILNSIIKMISLNLKIQEDGGKFFIRTSKISLAQLEKIKKRFNITYSLTYLFELVDSDKIAVESIAKSIEKMFEIKGKIQKKKGAWSLRIYNKVFIRYFRLWGLKYGRKTETIKEPQIIRRGNLESRQSFARGVITFDGSVAYAGNVAITLKSKDLIEDIHEIMKLSNIKSVISKREGGYEISLDKNNKDLINFIIPYTKKWFRIKDFFNGFSLRVKSAEEAKKILYETYDKYNRVSVSFNDLVSYLQKNRSIETNKVKEFDKTTAFYTKLRILERMQIVTGKHVVSRNKKGNFKERYKLYGLNKDVRKWRLPSYRIYEDT